MPLPLLQTKLYLPPARANLVNRSQLIERLKVGGGRPFTLVSAPAGFGKTTLVSAWLNEVRNDTKAIATIGNPKLVVEPSQFPIPQVAWLSLDEDDNDPTRFLTYVIAALQTQQPSLGESTLALLAAPQAPPPKSILTQLINDVTTLAAPLLLVLDDYHLITTPAIHEALTFLLDHLPVNLHLVITTRVDPPLPLSRWRVRQQMLEIRADDLRFSVAEAAIFLNEIMGLRLPAEQIATLDVRTEGWIAGLQLAALSMQGHQDVKGFVSAFAGSHHYIMDYLLEEVLQQLPPTTLAFLLQTSILDRFCAALCDAVTGRTDGQVMLAQLQRLNLFLIPLDDERRWYRYHHLFDEMLHHRLSQVRHQLTENPSPQVTISTLHRRASQWWDANGFIDRAIHHALSAQDFAQATLLIDRSYMRWLGSGQVVTLQRWLDAFPTALWQSQPTLNLAQAWVHLNAGRIGAAQTYTQAAEVALVHWSAAEAHVQKSTHQAIRVTYAFIANIGGSSPQTIVQAEAILTELPPDQALWRSLLANVLAFAYYWQGDMSSASKFAHEALAQAMLTRNSEVATRGMIGAICEMRGRLEEAETWLRQSIQLGTFEGKVLPTTQIAAAYGALGRIHYQRHQWHESADSLARALEISTQLQDVVVLHVALRGQIRLLRSQGDFVAALAHLQRLESIQSSGPYKPLMIEAMRALIWLEQGESARARTWLTEDRLKIANSPVAIDLRNESALLPLAEVLLRLGHHEPATRLLTRLSASAVQGERIQSVIQILVLQAILYQLQADKQRAFAALGEALTLGEPSGYLAFFVEQGAPMRRLLAELRSTISTLSLRAYAEQLLAGFPQQDEATHNQGHSHAQSQNLIEPLSERELEILHLVNAGLSNREIADKIIVTVGTVKKHLNNIFGKLGVNSRTQALMQARALHLLEV